MKKLKKLSKKQLIQLFKTSERIVQSLQQQSIQLQDELEDVPRFRKVAEAHTQTLKNLINILGINPNDFDSEQGVLYEIEGAVKMLQAQATCEVKGEPDCVFPIGGVFPKPNAGTSGVGEALFNAMNRNGWGADFGRSESKKVMGVFDGGGYRELTMQGAVDTMNKQQEEIKILEERLATERLNHSKAKQAYFDLEQMLAEAHKEIGEQKEKQKHLRVQEDELKHNNQTLADSYSKLWNEKQDLANLLDVTTIQRDDAKKQAANLAENCSKYLQELQQYKASSFDSLFKDLANWQHETFGTATATSKAYHLQREVKELIEALEFPTTEEAIREEYADCFLLLFGSAASNLMDLPAIKRAILKKLEINKKRVWGKPDAEGVVSHVKEATQDQKDRV